MNTVASVAKSPRAAHTAREEATARWQPRAGASRLQGRGLTQPPAMATRLPFPSQHPHASGRFWKRPPPSKARVRCFAAFHPSTAGGSHSVLKHGALCQAHAKCPIQTTVLVQQDESSSTYSLGQQTACQKPELPVTPGA